MGAGAPSALQRSGDKDHETAKQRVEELLKRSDAMFEKGYVPEMVLSTLAVRKAG